MAHVVVVGAGAIGSHLLPHLARSPRVSQLTVIDRDRYNASNTSGQQIDARDIGRLKVSAQARRLRRINQNLQVVPIHASVERLPLGLLRGSMILAALDSREARMVVNQAAWRLGVPWIDAGVHADGMLARVRVFVPSEDAPCLECAWDQDDYDALEQTYPCAPGVTQGATGAPSTLGAVAAALQAAECDKLLSGDRPHALTGREVLLDLRHHTHSVTTFRRNPSCRMPDHAGWRISTLGVCGRTTVDEFLALGSTLRGAAVSLAFGIAGQRIATELRCDVCDVPHTTCQTERHARVSRPRCAQCGNRLRVTGVGLRNFAPAAMVPILLRQQRLADMGVRPRDVLTLRTPEVDAHFEVETI